MTDSAHTPVKPLLVKIALKIKNETNKKTYFFFEKIEVFTVKNVVLVEVWVFFGN